MPKPTHDRQVFWIALAGGAPAVGLSMYLLWTQGFKLHVELTFTLIVLLCWLELAAMVRRRVIAPLQTFANLLSALHEGDFSIRANQPEGRGPVNDVVAEINSLGKLLHDQRIGALEATTLLGRVIAEIDVAIFTFDSENQLRLVNPAAQRLLDKPSEKLLDRSASELGLEELLEGEDRRVLDSFHFSDKSNSGRWSLRRSTFREDGHAHTLVVIADVSHALREEEVKAWQRLVRVLGHELNNSLAPIKSIAGSLGTLLEQPKRPADWEDDLRDGLKIIATRTDGLGRFMEAYARLTRLPPPVTAPVEIGDLIHRVAQLEIRQTVKVAEGPNLPVLIDSAQIEQVLINLIANAVEAASETGSEVQISWKQSQNVVEILITDGGLGIASSANLFVPFFTTKEKGSGIGLVLCRQIIENHHGSISLENRNDGPSGCVARLRLPLQA